MNKKITGLLLSAVFIIYSCTNTSNMKTKGSFGYDYEFLKKHQPSALLLSDSNSKAMLLVSPQWQGRVMTSSANGNDGFSFGWVNYKLIESGKIQPHINAFGGEERLWLGPEGGQFSVYFKPGSKFVYDSWQVPKEIDTVAFEVTKVSQTSVSLKKEFELQNYSGFQFKLRINRQIDLLSNQDISNYLKIDIPGNLKCVGYQTKNELINTGKEAWNEKSGLLSIWMLSMFNPSEKVTVLIPVKENDSVPAVNDNYFGKVSADRLKTIDDNVFFKCDGRSRSKIGIPPARSKGFVASYDATNGILTILQCDTPKEKSKYVNSAWELQKEPYSGDAINSYNDGPLEDGSQMGPFYEIESSSAVKPLASGDSILHCQRIYHFQGDKEELNKLTLTLFDISLDRINEVFNK
jgi:hypothetical protein